jgi:hypothetical protein
MAEVGLTHEPRPLRQNHVIIHSELNPILKLTLKETVVRVGALNEISHALSACDKSFVWVQRLLWSSV